MESIQNSKDLKFISEKLHKLNNSVTLISGNLPFLKESWKEIKPILEKLPSEKEIARIPINDFFNEYDDVLEEIEIGCKKIMQIINEIKQNTNKRYEKK